MLQKRKLHLILKQMKSLFNDDSLLEPKGENMKTIKTIYDNGIYNASIDITVEEWMEMLLNEKIFYENCRQIMIDWYYQPDHQATTKEILNKKGLSGKKKHYNGEINGLGKRIINHLNRFKVVNTHGDKKSFWIIPFEGWYEDFDFNKHFVWKLRDELSVALEKTGLVSVQSSLTEQIESYESKRFMEGGKIKYYTSKYERNVNNRLEAIRIHGTKCMICGFDFEQVYGLHGKGYIEVHHICPLSEQDGEVEIDPTNDLICVCANCHRMIHHFKYNTLSPEALKIIVSENASKRDSCEKKV